MTLQHETGHLGQIQETEILKCWMVTIISTVEYQAFWSPCIKQGMWQITSPQSSWPQSVFAKAQLLEPIWMSDYLGGLHHQSIKCTHCLWSLQSRQLLSPSYSPSLLSFPGPGPPPYLQFWFHSSWSPQFWLQAVPVLLSSVLGQQEQHNF